MHKYKELKIKLTKHCKQRRNHFDIKEDSEILKWVHYFIDRFDLSEQNNSVYKIQSKKYFMILDLKDKILTIITFVNFNDSIFEEKDKMRFILKDLTTKEITRLHRINFVGRTVHCGNITYNKNGSVRVKLKKDVLTKYIIPENLLLNLTQSTKGALFDSLEECQKIMLKIIKNKKVITFERKE